MGGGKDRAELLARAAGYELSRALELGSQLRWQGGGALCWRSLRRRSFLGGRLGCRGFHGGNVRVGLAGWQVRGGARGRVRLRRRLRSRNRRFGRELAGDGFQPLLDGAGELPKRCFLLLVQGYFGQHHGSVLPLAKLHHTLEPGLGQYGRLDELLAGLEIDERLLAGACPRPRAAAQTTRLLGPGFVSQYSIGGGQGAREVSIFKRQLSQLQTPR